MSAKIDLAQLPSLTELRVPAEVQAIVNEICDSSDVRGLETSAIELLTRVLVAYGKGLSPFREAPSKLTAADGVCEFVHASSDDAYRLMNYVLYQGDRP